jgi:NAD(P)-dependent dehydrogenase (short-subunit alcohol dehydrogenase family)
MVVIHKREAREVEAAAGFSISPIRFGGSIMNRLTSKTALITGGSSGIGLATAKLFAAEGARVAIVGRDAAKLKAAAAAIGAGTVAVAADITDPQALEIAIKDAAGALGKLDIVFANAGIGGATPLGSTTPAGFDAIVRSNLTSVFFTVQSALPHLNDGGSIILNGSVHATFGSPGWSAYAATKGAVRSLTRSFAGELAPRGIRVNQVTPGGTRTPIWSPFAPNAEAEKALEARISQAVPLGRMGEADEIARAALYLASEDSLYVTGTEIVVDGGATSAPQGAPIYRG